MERNKLRTQAILDQRIRSLAEDDYLVRFRSAGLQLDFIKLKHKHNGNEIIIKADHLRDRMTQTTNGKLVYQGTIQP